MLVDDEEGVGSGVGVLKMFRSLQIGEGSRSDMTTVSQREILCQSTRITDQISNQLMNLLPSLSGSRSSSGESKSVVGGER